MKRVDAIIKPHTLDDVKQALTAVGVQGMTVREVKGFGRTLGKKEIFRGSAYQIDFIPKLEVTVVIADNLLHSVLEAIEKAAKTGSIGDGKIFISEVAEVIRIRTGERGPDAL